MATVKDNLRTVKARIASACAAAGRDPAGVNLLAVSKTHPTQAICDAWQAGQVHFGENYLQDALKKIEALPALDWHYIGAIQSNKTRLVANNFSWVHTVASEKVARRLSEQRETRLPALKVLIQVNISNEQTKSGVSAENLNQLYARIKDLQGLEFRGLMTIPAATSDPELQRTSFRLLRELREELQLRHDAPHFTDLSMGMSSDFETAILEGSTWIRVGTDIFGPRTKNESGQER
jgi:pyridoxal phosphate enzyme (YggS family)